MTTTKIVREVTFNFYCKYIDALLGTDKFFTEVVEVEDNNPPEQVTSKITSDVFRLKSFQRTENGHTGIYKSYLKIS